WTLIAVTWPKRGCALPSREDESPTGCIRHSGPRGHIVSENRCVVLGIEALPLGSAASILQQMLRAPIHGSHSHRNQNRSQKPKCWTAYQGHGQTSLHRNASFEKSGDRFEDTSDTNLS